MWLTRHFSHCTLQISQEIGTITVYRIHYKTVKTKLSFYGEGGEAFKVMYQKSLRNLIKSYTKNSSVGLVGFYSSLDALPSLMA